MEDGENELHSAEAGVTIGLGAALVRFEQCQIGRELRPGEIL
jgi:hypothetical protein